MLYKYTFMNKIWYMNYQTSLKYLKRALNYWSNF